MVTLPLCGLRRKCVLRRFWSSSRAALHGASKCSVSVLRTLTTKTSQSLLSLLDTILSTYIHFSLFS